MVRSILRSTGGGPQPPGRSLTLGASSKEATRSQLGGERGYTEKAPRYLQRPAGGYSHGHVPSDDGSTDARGRNPQVAESAEMRRIQSENSSFSGKTEG